MQSTCRHIHRGRDSSRRRGSRRRNRRRKRRRRRRKRRSQLQWALSESTAIQAATGRTFHPADPSSSFPRQPAPNIRHLPSSNQPRLSVCRCRSLHKAATSCRGRWEGRGGAEHHNTGHTDPRRPHARLNNKLTRLSYCCSCPISF